jgi:serine/threonine-protein kinase
MSVYCDNCNQENNDTETLCHKCGYSLLTEKKLKPGIILHENYEIKRLIKSGGMGAVYEALDKRFDTLCAVKEMLGQAGESGNNQYMIDSFKREARILRSLNHSNIPVIRDYFIDGNRYYLVMDYIEGKDLETVLQGYGEHGVPEDLVIKWTKEILHALEYLHSQDPPVIYRDMKPENVMLRSTDDKIMLIDFGLARTVNPQSQDTMTSVGTPAYAPKELFQGQPEVRTDIYSLGATMHCLLTGIIPVIPFDFSPVREINSGVSEEIEEIVMKALSMEPVDRYGSAKEMKEAIENLSGHSSQIMKENHGQNEKKSSWYRNLISFLFP